MSDERLHPDEPAAGMAAHAEPTAHKGLSAVERARRAWVRRPGRGSAAAERVSQAGPDRASRIDPARSAELDPGAGPGGMLPERGVATIDSERSEPGESGNGPAPSEVIRASASVAQVAPWPRSTGIVELRDVAGSAKANGAGSSAGGGEGARRRLRWVGWISRRVFHG